MIGHYFFFFNYRTFFFILLTFIHRYIHHRCHYMSCSKHELDILTALEQVFFFLPLLGRQCGV